jgi:predicted MFS family arabinose efflux permease
MIQRQQTLWLILAAVASFLTFQFPFYTGTRLENNVTTLRELEGGSNFFLLVLTGISLLIGAIAIFLYKDRKTQLKLAIAGAVVAIIIVILYFVQIKNFIEGHFALTCLFAIAIPIGFIMAARGIWKDEKLVKSLDKLR